MLLCNLVIAKEITWGDIPEEWLETDSYVDVNEDGMVNLKDFDLVIKNVYEVSMGTDYFVKNGGDNSANGESDATAWETVAKVNGYTFSAGDTISFNKGDMWREALVVHDSGDLNDPIVYQSYGTGDKPVLYGSTNISDSGWTAEVGSAYKHDFIAVNVNPGATVQHWTGIEWDVFTLGGSSTTLNVGEYYYMHTETPKAIYIRMRDDSNPDGEIFEVSSNAMNITSNGKSYWTIKDMVFGFAVKGADIRTDGVGGTIKDCTIKNTGGDGISLTGTVSGFVVDGCLITGCGDGNLAGVSGDAVTFHNDCRGTVKNCILANNDVSGIAHIGDCHGYHYNNLIYGNTDNIIIYENSTGGHTFVNNIIFCTSRTEKGIQLGSGSSSTAQVIIKNCTIYGEDGNSTTEGIYVRGHNVTIENTIIENIDGFGIWQTNSTDATLSLSNNNIYNNGTDYSTAVADENSISTDSNFMDISSYDFTPQNIEVLTGGELDVNGNPTHIGAIAPPQ